MGPKKKGGKSSKGARGSGGIIDGVSMTEMSREQLEQFTLRIREELEREREERNFFQLERDKLRTFWELTWQQQEEIKAELRNKDRALEEADETHQLEIKIYKEKVKHLLYEHQSNLTNLKAESMVGLKLAEEEYREQEGLLLADKEALKAEAVQAELNREAAFRDLQMKHSEEVEKVRSELLLMLEEIGARGEARAERLEANWQLRARTEQALTEEIYRSRAAAAAKQAAQATADLRNLYHHITNNNLALIATLKDEVLVFKAKNEELEKMVRKLSEEKERLSGPLAEARAKVSELQRELALRVKDRASLTNLYKRIGALGKEVSDLKLERDSLEIKVEEAEKELVRARESRGQAELEAGRRRGLERSAASRRIAELEDQLESREIELAHLVSKANLDPTAVISASRKLEAARELQEKRISDLELELARAVQAHDDLLSLVPPHLSLPGPLRPRLQSLLTPRT